MAKLTLLYRDVARLNVDRFDHLAAFHGFNTCQYHYCNTDGTLLDVHCAIGIADPEYKLIDFIAPVVTLSDNNIIRTDNLRKLKFIQDLHDACINGRRHVPYPNSVEHIMARCIAAETITPDDYKEIMTILANEP